MDGHRSWIDLVNAQDGWLTDESMLRVIPEDSREFGSVPEWPKPKALAYLNNNVSALRLNHARLEGGEPLDLDLLNAVLDGISLRVVDWRQRADFRELAVERWRRGERLVFLQPPAESEGWNRGTVHLRALVRRATFHFARYVDQRLADPAYPGATPGTLRVLRCSAPQCTTLVPCPAGRPQFCSERCSEDTGRLA